MSMKGGEAETVSQVHTDTAPAKQGMVTAYERIDDNGFKVYVFHPLDYTKAVFVDLCTSQQLRNLCRCITTDTRRAEQTSLKVHTVK